MIRRLVLSLCLVAMGISAYAQNPTWQTSVQLARGYDLDDATNYRYCASTGLNATVWGDWYPQTKKAKTSGSSTTITSNTASDGVFQNIAAGDILLFTETETTGQTYRGQSAYRYVVTRTSADSIVVDSAIDLSGGHTFKYRNVSCGTASTSGWVPVNGVTAGNFQLSVSQITTDTAGISYKVECKMDGGDPTVIVGPTTVLDTVAAYGVVWYEPWDYCRFGFKIVTADDGTDTTTAKEILTLVLSVRR